MKIPPTLLTLLLSVTVLGAEPLAPITELKFTWVDPDDAAVAEIRQVGEIFLYQRVEAARETREIRRIEHEQPDIA